MGKRMTRFMDVFMPLVGLAGVLMIIASLYMVTVAEAPLWKKVVVYGYAFGITYFGVYKGVYLKTKNEKGGK